MENTTIIVGSGLAGSEAAYQLLKRGQSVLLVEMRPKKMTEAHHSELPAELVCSNSLRSNDIGNAVGLLKEEMASLDSLIIRAAHFAKVPAGSALAVDRDVFSKYVDDCLGQFKRLQRINDIVTHVNSLEDGSLEVVCESGESYRAGRVVLATGPLTDEKLAQWILEKTGQEYLYFYDSIAPIVDAESIDMNKAWRQSRYDKGESEEGDYLNCPMTKDQYEAFINAIEKAELTEVKDFDKACFFDGCLPIEEMIRRGRDTLLFGPMKPVGLTNPHNPEVKPHAVVQLRQDNLHATLFNMVGYQTRMKWGEQKRIFQMIPGLENAEFFRMGSMHRNTFICSPTLLKDGMELNALPNLHFAGQITGCEGYVESAAIGLYVGMSLWHKSCVHESLPKIPATTALGALVNHVLHADPKDYQPMNINWGLFDAIDRPLKKHEKKFYMVKRAAADFRTWLYRVEEQNG